MCGDSSQQDENYEEQTSFAQQMQDENTAVFGQQQGILSNLNAGFQKIIAAGPSQLGYSPDQKNNLDTQATEAVAQNNTQAKMALGNGQAAQGGGDTFIPSGVKDQQDEELASTAASTNASLHSQILQADYNEGNSNYNAAVTGDEAVAGDLNPTGYGATTATSLSNAGNEANSIAASANSPFTAVMGALGGVAGTAGGVITNNLMKPCWIAAEIFGGWDEPRTVLVREWLLRDFQHRSAAGFILVDLYRIYGERVAMLVRKYRPLRWFFTPIFNLALRQARKAH